MQTLQLLQPFEQQKQFLRAQSRFVAYGGSRGGGKSVAVRMKAKLLCMNYPKIKILILRKTYPELLENHIRIMAADLAHIAQYKDSDKSMTFPNGSLIKFGYCASDADVTQYQGQEYDVIFMDEATHFTEWQFNALKACMRGANDLPKRFYITCNPGGVGHAWVKRLFIDRDYTADEKPEDYTFIRSSVYDNKPLLEKDPEYLNMLKNQTDVVRRRWLDGDWDVLAGQFFPEFSREVHVCEPFPIPEWWKKYKALDYGLDMLACLWAAVNDLGEIYIYQELCQSDLIVSDAAHRILAMGDHDTITYAPPDLWGRTKDTGKTMDELFYDNGLILTKAGNNRVQGWAAVREFLKRVPAPESTPERPIETAKLHIFSNCTELIRCLPLLTWNEHRAGDCSEVPHDITHAPDALRYLIISRVTPSKEPEYKDFLEKHKESKFKETRKNVQRRKW